MENGNSYQDGSEESKSGIKSHNNWTTIFSHNKGRKGSIRYFNLKRVSGIIPISFPGRSGQVRNMLAHGIQFLEGGSSLGGGRWNCVGSRKKL